MNTHSKQGDEGLEQIERRIRETPVEIDLVSRTMHKYEMQQQGKQRAKCSPYNKIYQKVMIVTTSVALIFSIAFITSFISPTMAATMKELPLFSSVFKFTRDQGLHAADEKGLSTKLNTSVTHEGFTLSVTEVVYDGTRVAIGVERHLKEGAKTTESLSDQLSNIDFLLNGKPLDYPDIGAIYRQPSKDRHSGVIELTDRKNQGGKPFPKQFTLTLLATIAGISEPFKMEIPVSDIGNYVNLQPNISRKHKNTQLTVERIVLTPMTTSITTRKSLLDKSTSVDSRDGIRIAVFDDQGRELKLVLGSGSRETNSGKSDLIADLQVHPSETFPKAITIKPYTYQYDKYPNGSFVRDENGDPKIQYIPELEMTIPIKDEK